MANDKKKEASIPWYIIVSLFLGVIALFTLSWSFIDHYIPCPENRGFFGDKFGAINALFSGLAFAGLILTLLLQKRELSLQREELEQTRTEFKEQNRTIKRQRFENTFFNMLSLLLDIVNHLEYTCIDGLNDFEAAGRDVFIKFYYEKQNLGYTYGLKGYFSKKGINDFEKYPDIDVILPYLRFFDGIVHYIESSDLLDENERYQYTEILRNSLSEAELYIIFYYYAACGGWHKQVAENYALFYNVVPQSLADSKHFDLFEPGAYNHIVV